MLFAFDLNELEELKRCVEYERLILRQIEEILGQIVVTSNQNVDFNFQIFQQVIDFATQERENFYEREKLLTEIYNVLLKSKQKGNCATEDIARQLQMLDNI